MPKFIDLVGKRFERLTVISENSRNQRGVIWNCRCDCGNNKIAHSIDLRWGKIKSCGCLFDEVSKINLAIAHTWNKIEYGKASFNIVYRNYKNHAKERNFSFDLSEEKFKELSQMNCFYCGIEPRQIQRATGNNGDFVYNGIDRIDSSLGYTLENIVPCCGRCNEAKMSEDQTDFINWIEKVYKNLFKENQNA